jgi:hypothetical protein
MHLTSVFIEMVFIEGCHEKIVQVAFFELPADSALVFLGFILPLVATKLAFVRRVLIEGVVR